MAWICPKCNTNNVNLNLRCVYCYVRHRIVTKRIEDFEPFDELDEIISERTLKQLDRITNFFYRASETSEKMTPQEELFAKFFNHEKILVSTMNTLELRAHREELVKIAFEARARITADDEEEKNRKPKNDGKPTGFARSVNGDAATSELINTVKVRQKNLTKKEKLIEGLIKLGYSRSDAEKKMTAGELLGKFKNQIVESENKVKEEAKPFTNPFLKKE